MAKLRDRAFKKVFGSSDARKVGRHRAMRGLREGDSRELALGLVLTAIGYLQRTKPKKERIYRQELAEDAVLVIRHRNSGESKLEIIRPDDR